MRSGATLVATVAVAVLLVAAPATPAGAETGGAYRPPVDRPIVDPFRPPPNPYGAGNRGVDYETEPGEPVTAAAGGEVVFAGTVGRSQHVVVLHPDGIRTSYSFLADVAVRRGDRVRAGDVVGTAATALHFGARAGDRYVDPTLLFGGGAVDVHLVPTDTTARPGSEAAERAGLLRALAGAVLRVHGAATDLASWAAQAGWDAVWLELESLWTKAVVLLAYQQTFLVPGLEAMRQWRRMQPFLASQEGCTPAGEPPPPPPAGPRLVVLVGGFGSSDGEGSVLDVDTAALGYAPDEVVEFSYGGDSTGDLNDAAARLRDLLQDLRAARPGVPVDIVAHSQGGLVARAALGEPGDAFDPRLPPVDHLVTLGSPHQGADLATANAGIGTTAVGQLAQVIVGEAGGPDGTAVAAGQLSETSAFIRQVNERPLPAGTRVTSIAARGDLVVGALSSSLDGATNVVVPLAGPAAHADLPGSPEATREIALALAHRGPTCRDVRLDLAGAAALGWIEDGLGALATMGGTWVDLRMPGPSVPVRTPGGR